LCPSHRTWSQWCARASAWLVSSAGSIPRIDRSPSSWERGPETCPTVRLADYAQVA
jgi:hypothetical protein